MIGETTALAPIVGALRDALARAAVGAGDRLVIACSGGGDSTALLLGARALGADGPSLHAVHVDHRLDRRSDRRAAAARRLAERSGIAFHLAVLDPSRIRAHRGGLEAGARALRYRALAAWADRLGARFVITAHHADDQAETVLLRLVYGSSWIGLGGMAGRRGRLLRPLLGLRRAQLATAVRAAALCIDEDPANRDPAFARSAIRHRVLPRLAHEAPDLVLRLGRLARSARSARQRLGDRLGADLQLDAEDDGIWAVDRRALARLDEPLAAASLDLLARRARAPHPPTGRARREALCQLRRSGPVAVDAGGGWRLEGDSRHLRMVPPRIHPAPFTYTLPTPGRVGLPAHDWALEARIAAVAPWMFRHQKDRAALGLDRLAGRSVAVRNRRPGDRLRPFGDAGARRLKDLLIDRRVPRHRRDRLPLVTVDGQVAWVPGVTIDHRFRVGRADRQAWSLVLTPGKAGEAAAGGRDPARNLWWPESVAPKGTVELNGTR